MSTTKGGKRELTIQPAQEIPTQDPVVVEPQAKRAREEDLTVAEIDARAAAALAKKKKEQSEIPLPEIPDGMDKEDALAVLNKIIAYNVLTYTSIYGLQKIQWKWMGKKPMKQGM